MIVLTLFFGSYSSYIYLSYGFVLGALSLLAIISIRRHTKLSKMISRLETAENKK